MTRVADSVNIVPKQHKDGGLLYAKVQGLSNMIVSQ